MANKLLQLPGNRLFNNSNIASPGGTATLYLSKTSTLANFLDASAVPLGPTITANGLGQLPDAYGDETVAYRVILRDSSGVQLDGGDIDPFYFGRDNSLITTTAGSSVSTRALLAAITLPQANQSAILTESGREGTFVFSSANLSAQVTADTTQGIYVAPSSDTTGASGAWVRDWDGVNGRAEWFGADPTGGADSLAALQACIALCPVTRLRGGDYLISNTLKHGQEHRAIIGVGSTYSSSSFQVTRILTTSASSTILQMGPDAYPGSINAMPQGIVLRDLYLGRSVAPSIASNAIGLRVQWNLFGRIENVKTGDSIIGASYNGTVHLQAINVETVRAQAGTGAGTDYFVGHHIDGSGNIGAAGGNASLYLIRPNAGCNYGPLQTVSGSIAYKLDGAFTDVFIDHPESGQFYDGIAVFGNGAVGNSFSNTDCHISHPIMDQFSNAGIYVTNIAEAGAIEVTEPYCGPGPGARSAIWINANIGAVRVAGGQLVMGGQNGCQGVLISASSNASVDGTVILEAGNTYPVVGVVDSSNCLIRPRIKNRAVAGGAAVQLSGTCTANVVEPMVSGSAAKLQFGIQVVGAGDDRNEYRVSGIDSICLVSAARKLDRNGTAVSAVGLTGTNYASGVFA